MRILLAEDNSTVRDLLLQDLSDIGTVDIATEGREAVAAFKQALDIRQPYDLVCLDIMMPKVDGIDALKRIRQLESLEGPKFTKQCKIIMLTSVSDKEVVLAALKAGCDDYVIKPIDRETLFDKIQKLGLKISNPG